MARITIESINEELKETGWKCVSETYQNLDTPLEFECDEGHTVQATWKKIRSKCECPRCKDNKLKEKVNQDKSEIIKSIDRDFKLNLEEAKKDKQEWEKQEKGEFIIEWEEEKQPKEEEKQFEDSEFIIEW